MKEEYPDLNEQIERSMDIRDASSIDKRHGDWKAFYDTQNDTSVYEGGNLDNINEIVGSKGHDQIKTKGKKMNKGTTDQNLLEKRRKKALYGSRASSKIFESA